MATIANPEKSQFYAPLLAAVLAGKSIASAAEVAGCSSHYAYELTNTATFKMAVSRHRTELMEGILGQLREAAVVAVQTLQELTGTGDLEEMAINRDARVRIPAAKVTLSQLLPMTENLELRQRLDALEQAAAESKTGDPDHE